MYPDPPTATKPATLAEEAELTANNSKSNDNKCTIFSSSLTRACARRPCPPSVYQRYVILSCSDTIPGEPGDGRGGLPYRDVDVRLATRTILGVIRAIFAP